MTGDVTAALRNGQLRAALDLYNGPLLARSDAPALRAERDEPDATLRRAALDSDDPDVLWHFAQTSTGAEDLEIFECLDTTLPADDPRRPAVAAHLDRLTR